MARVCARIHSHPLPRGRTDFLEQIHLRGGGGGGSQGLAVALRLMSGVTSGFPGKCVSRELQVESGPLLDSRGVYLLCYEPQRHPVSETILGFASIEKLQGHLDGSVGRECDSGS